MAVLTTQQKLDEAESAYHALMIGELEVTVSKNGKSVTYNATTAHKLERYIAQLKAILNPSLSRRAIRVAV